MDNISLDRINKNSELGLFKSHTHDQQSTFMSVMEDALRQTNELQLISDQYAERIASGQIDNIHEAMIAGQKADISLQMMAAVRGKIMEAYREIMRMQI